MLLLNQKGSKLAMRSEKLVQGTNCGLTIYVGKMLRLVSEFGGYACGERDPNSDTL